MEGLKLEALKAALFVLPGVISLRVKAALAISAPSKPLNAVIDALVLTLADHAVFASVRSALLSFNDCSTCVGLVQLGRDLSTSPSLPSDLGRAFVDAGGFPIIAIAVAVGLIWGAVRYHGWDFRVLRFLRLTNRTGENLVWAETLTKASPGYAVVACKDGSRFLGVIDTFSETAGDYELLLGRAAQIQPDGSLLPIEGEGVLLTRENPVIRVELWRPAVTERMEHVEGTDRQSQ